MIVLFSHCARVSFHIDSLKCAVCRAGVISGRKEMEEKQRTILGRKPAAAADDDDNDDDW